MWENIATCMICHHAEVNICKYLWYFAFVACNFALFKCFLRTVLPETFGARKMTWMHVFFLVVDMSYLFEEDEIWHYLMRWNFKRVEITMETGFCFVDNDFFDVCVIFFATGDRFWLRVIYQIWNDGQKTCQQDIPSSPKCILHMWNNFI